MMHARSRLLWNRTPANWDTLRDALVDLQKQHSRVEHDRDDALIARHVAAALSIVERRANINLAPATFASRGHDVSSVLASCCCWCPYVQAQGFALPFNNVRDLRLMDDSEPPADIAPAEWEIVQEHFGGNAEAYLVTNSATGEPFPTGSLEIDAGVEEIDEIDPAVLAVVLRIGASLYEYREADLALTEATFAPELAQIWRPDV